jgi:hypothetical protein
MVVDLSGARSTPPPARSTRGATKAAAAKSSNPKTVKREDSLNGIAQLLAMGAAMMKWDADAIALKSGLPPVNHEIATLAESNEKIADGIDRLENVGPYGALLVPLMALSLQLAANHGLVSASVGFGVRDPDALRAEMKQERIRLAREVMEAREAAERDEAEFMKDLASKNSMVLHGQAEPSE